MFELSKISAEELQLALAILSPNYDYLARYIDEVTDGEAWKDKQIGALLVGPNPGKGTHAFDIMLFPPTTALGSDQILGYSRRPIPAKLREFLSYSNGCKLGELSIYGVVSEFSRSVRAPLDIGRENFGELVMRLVMLASPCLAREIPAAQDRLAISSRDMAQFLAEETMSRMLRQNQGVG